MQNNLLYRQNRESDNGFALYRVAVLLTHPTGYGFGMLLSYCTSTVSDDEPFIRQIYATHPSTLFLLTYRKDAFRLASLSPWESYVGRVRSVLTVLTSTLHEALQLNGAFNTGIAVANGLNDSDEILPGSRTKTFS